MKIVIKLLMMKLVLLTSLNAQEIIIDETIESPKVLIKTTFTRDNTKEVVVNDLTGLMWQDNKESKTVEEDFENAKEYCEKLNFADYSDWYLPTIKELQSIAEPENYPIAIVKSFQNITPEDYWSASVYKSFSKEYAWVVFFDHGNSYRSTKTDRYYVRCVRAGQ